jgi:hypothetical protein
MNFGQWLEIACDNFIHFRLFYFLSFSLPSSFVLSLSIIFAPFSYQFPLDAIKHAEKKVVE